MTPPPSRSLESSTLSPLSRQFALRRENFYHPFPRNMAKARVLTLEPNDLRERGMPHRDAIAHRGRIDAIAQRAEAPILLLGRVALAALYLPSGWGKLTNIAGFAGVLASKGLPGPAMAWAAVGAAVEFFGSLAILLGFKT